VKDAMARLFRHRQTKPIFLCQGFWLSCSVDSKYWKSSASQRKAFYGVNPWLVALLSGSLASPRTRHGKMLFISPKKTLICIL
jgi:hypothetical protein